MADSSRDRVTIDLRGIGDAVRAAAAGGGLTVAALARQALVDTIGPQLGHAPLAALDSSERQRGVVKLTLRLREPDAEVLSVNAIGRGLSYGEYVAQMIRRTPLPMPATERAADRAALMTSSDALAVLSTDLNAFIRLLRMGKSAEAEKYRRRIETVDVDIRRHLDLASTFIANP
jgi:hypothetical protein